MERLVVCFLVGVCWGFCWFEICENYQIRRPVWIHLGLFGGVLLLSLPITLVFSILA